jgi:hypothetical protein
VALQSCKDLGRLTPEVSWSIETLGRTPLDEWSTRRKGLYLHRTTQHRNTTDKTSMPRTRFEPKIPVTKRPQTYALDRAATGTGVSVSRSLHFNNCSASFFTTFLQVDLDTSVDKQMTGLLHSMAPVVTVTLIMIILTCSSPMSFIIRYLSIIRSFYANIVWQRLRETQITCKQMNN